MQQEPTSLDPTGDAAAAIDGMLTHNVYESLTTVDQSGTVLCRTSPKAGHVSADGLTYTFTLAEGVTFHDGTARSMRKTSSFHL